jgi:hypothetical protein
MRMKRWWLQRLDNKFGRYAVHNLMNIIVFGMALVYIADIVLFIENGKILSSVFDFDRFLIFDGQIWRLISFVIIPPGASIIFIFLALYILWMLGSALEHEWGAFKFNIFYLFGILGSIAAGLITGYATNIFLNMSLFLAFAILYPNYMFHIFFIIPIKVKYLAYLDAVFIIFLLIISHWTGKIAVIVSLINILIFFWRDLLDGLRLLFRRIAIKLKINRGVRKTGRNNNIPNSNK